MIKHQHQPADKCEGNSFANHRHLITLSTGRCFVFSPQTKTASLITLSGGQRPGELKTRRHFLSEEL